MKPQNKTQKNRPPPKNQTGKNRPRITLGKVEK
jgi:hypothetical protein